MKRLDDLLTAHVNGGELIINGLPTVQQINRGRGRLSTTELSVSEIAYELGFERPQSFNKLFKAKTNQSPLAFWASFN